MSVLQWIAAGVVAGFYIGAAAFILERWRRDRDGGEW
jgi:hypothetical protein